MTLMMNILFLVVAVLVMKIQEGDAFDYKGCYRDGHFSSRILPVFAYLGRGDINIGKCIEACRGMRLGYAGLEYSKECWCGSSKYRFHPAPDRECWMPCRDDKSQICGGSYRLSVYRVTGRDPNYKGCWIDKRSRDLIHHVSLLGKKNTVENCRNRCRSLGYKYAGLQYSYQCFCDNSYGSYGRSASDVKDCSKRCKGNRNQRCGGGYRNSVYAV